MNEHGTVITDAVEKIEQKAIRLILKIAHASAEDVCS